LGLKKLYEDMTYEERDLLKNIINKIHRSYFTQHTLDRMSEKRVRRRDVLGVLKDYNIIEFHYTPYPRVLLRGNIRDCNNRCTCISIGLYTWDIVTTYKNNDTDNHGTLNYNNYMSSVNIKPLLKDIKNLYNN
jgi:hypothetical protein